MANYKLSDSVINELRQVCSNLTERRLAQIEAGFPLSWDQVQAGVLPEKWRTIVPQMVTDGFAIPINRRPRIKFEHVPGRSSATPEITRDAEAYIHARDKQFLVPNTSYVSLAFDLEVLDASTMARLAKWVNLAVGERRLAKLVNRTVQDFLKSHADTTGHVQARWPKLLLLADRLTDPVSAGRYVSHHAQERQASWKEKFHEKPRSLLRYRWHSPAETDWARRHETAMRLSETTLASALLLPPEHNEDAPVTAKIAKWTPLPDDPDRNMK